VDQEGVVGGHVAGAERHVDGGVLIHRLGRQGDREQLGGQPGVVAEVGEEASFVRTGDDLQPSVAGVGVVQGHPQCHRVEGVEGPRAAVLVPGRAPAGARRFDDPA